MRFFAKTTSANSASPRLGTNIEIPLMLPIDLESKIAALLTNLAGQLAALQPAYLSAKGGYWQGVRTHAIIPLEGLPTAPNPFAKPTDQAENWTAFGIVLPALTEAALSVESYRGPSGHGYVIHAEVISSGTRYRRSENFGPETYRTKPFIAVKTAQTT